MCVYVSTRTRFPDRPRHSGQPSSNDCGSHRLLHLRYIWAPSQELFEWQQPRAKAQLTAEKRKTILEKNEETQVCSRNARSVQMKFLAPPSHSKWGKQDHKPDSGSLKTGLLPLGLVE